MTCGVIVREKVSTWRAQTADVGLRGCRLELSRPVTRGALVRLGLHAIDGGPPLEVAGQVVWTKTAARREAGVLFVGSIDGRGPPATASWLDAAVAGQLQANARARRGMGTLGEVRLRLGAPPDELLGRDERAVVRAAQRGDAIETVAWAAPGLEALATLLGRGVVSVVSSSADLEGWRRAAPLLAELEPERVAGDAGPGDVLALHADETWRAAAITGMLEAYLTDGTKG